MRMNGRGTMDFISSFAKSIPEFGGLMFLLGPGQHLKLCPRFAFGPKWADLAFMKSRSTRPKSSQLPCLEDKWLNG